MRLLLVVSTAVVAALALSSGAMPATTAVTKNVGIGSGGLSPKTVSITADDTIVWKNNDNKNHQVVSTRGTFASPVLGPGQTYAFTFREAGNYGYRDALYPKQTGTVKVAGLPPALTFGVNAPQIGYGSSIMLSGQINSRKAGEQVTLTAAPYGQPSPVVLATVITGIDGTFAFKTKPQWLTSYQAKWKTATSLAASVAVAPVITLGRSSGWLSRVYAGRSMAAKTIQVQTVSSFGQWVTIKRVALGSGSKAHFSLNLSKGMHQLRVVMSVNQAGVGYLGATSSVVRWRTV